MKRVLSICFLAIGILPWKEAHACSVLYYVDHQSGKIFVANHEDYWYDVEAYIQIFPASGKKLARLWYGWDNFAQGGINEAGFFFDGAVTPEQVVPEGTHGPRGNLGDLLLAHCQTVEEALALLAKKDIGLKNAHMMLGDARGHAVVVEWMDGEQRLTRIRDNHLIMTNFLLADPSRGNHPCPRFQAIENQVDRLRKEKAPVDLQAVGNAIAVAARSPQETAEGRIGGTLYSSFINISDMEFVLIPKLDNASIIRLDLNETFEAKKKKRIHLINESTG
jgi:choloylglycine hydrolase